jgi:hypothetical protein
MKSPDGITRHRREKKHADDAAARCGRRVVQDMKKEVTALPGTNCNTRCFHELCYLYYIYSKNPAQKYKFLL